MSDLSRHPLFHGRSRSRANLLEVEVSWILPLDGAAARDLIARAESEGAHPALLAPLWPVGRANLAAHLCARGDDAVDALLDALAETNLQQLAHDLNGLHEKRGAEKFSPEKLGHPIVQLLYGYAESVAGVLAADADYERRVSALEDRLAESGSLVKLFLNVLFQYLRGEGVGIEAAEVVSAGMSGGDSAGGGEKTAGRRRFSLSALKGRVVRAPAVKAEPIRVVVDETDAGVGAEGIVDGEGESDGAEISLPEETIETTETDETTAVVTVTESDETATAAVTVAESDETTTAVTVAESDETTTAAVELSNETAEADETAAVTVAESDETYAVAVESSEETDEWHQHEEPREEEVEGIIVGRQTPPTRGEKVWVFFDRAPSLLFKSILRVGLQGIGRGAYAFGHGMRTLGVSASQQRKELQARAEAHQSSRAALRLERAAERARLAEEHRREIEEELRQQNEAEPTHQPIFVSGDEYTHDEQTEAVAEQEQTATPPAPSPSPSPLPSSQTTTPAPSSSPLPVSSAGAPVLVSFKRRRATEAAPYHPHQAETQPQPVHPARPAPMSAASGRGGGRRVRMSESTVYRRTPRIAVRGGGDPRARRHWRMAGFLAFLWHLFRETLHILDRPIIVPVSLVVLAVTFFLIWSGWQPDAPVAPADTGPAVSYESSPGGQEVQPEAGKRLPLTMPEVRYCLYQEERLQSLRERVNPYSEYEITRYNREVEDYNARCLDFLHPPGVVTAVRGEIGEWRGVLGEEAAEILRSWQLSAPDSEQNP
ncbi:MAG: hypothetical protein MPJ53_02080 [Alphaproteobacteria bacterium]|nr:hypothetical protein [Alphaproteobacteria bacterium]